MRKNFKFIIMSLSVILCLSFAAFAQGRTGTIEGTAKDTNGAVVPNATITVTGASFKQTVNANDEGFYRVIDVPPGDYSVSVQAGNFKTDTRNNVVVVIEKATVLDFDLQAGTGTVTVDVNADDVSGIDPTDSKIQTSLTAKNLENLPKGNNFSSALKAAPAVRPEVTGGGFQIDGASGSENTFVIDGQEVTNFRTGTLNAGNNIPFQQVQEIQIKSNGFEAQFGGATGGVINVVTKRGGDEFHGEAGIQFETSKLFASPRAVLLSNTTTLRYYQPAKDSFTNTFPALVLSGPIFKNRLNFFTSYTPQFRPTERNVNFVNGSRKYRQEDRRDYAFVRLDSDIFSKLRVNATYLYNPVKLNGVIPSFNTIGSSFIATTQNINTLPSEQSQFELGGRIPATNATVEGFYTPTQNLSVNVRFGRSYLNEKIDAYGVPNAVNYSCSTGNGGTLGTTGCTTGVTLFPSGNSATFKDISIRRTFDAIGTYYVGNLGGRHIFKGGYQYNGISNDVASGNTATGLLDFSFGGSTTDRRGCPRGVITGLPIPAGCSANPDPGALGVGSYSYSGAIGSVSSKNQAVFIQDSWTLFKRLTLNLGLRAESENVPTFDAIVSTGIKFGWGDKLAPRLGAAFDVLGNGKFKAFFSFGRFYDRFKYELPRGSFGGETFQQYDFIITNPSLLSYTPASVRANNVLFTDFRIPAFIDPNIKAFRQTEYTAGTEYQLGKNFILAGRFTHKQVDRAVEDIGAHVGDTDDEQYVIGNPGFGQCARPACGIYDVPGEGAAPKAERKYDAVEFRVDKRLSNNFFFNASYTYSRLFGNYAGLASSDEAQRGGGVGRNSPNVNRNFDVPFIGFTLDGKRDNGLLPTDRPHAFKIAAGYDFKWFGSKTNQTSVNVFQVIQSGTPVTSRVRLVNVSSQILSRRGDLGRTDRFAQTDFSIAHKYNFGRDDKYSMVFDVNILNLLNSATELSRRESLTRLNVPISIFGCTTAVCVDRGIFNGAVTSQKARDYAALGTVASPNKDQRFNQSQLFQDPRSVRFGFRFLF